MAQIPTSTSPRFLRGREALALIRGGSSAHKRLENSSFLVAGAAPQDEESAREAASRPTVTKMKLWKQYLNEAGDE